MTHDDTLYTYVQVAAMLDIPPSTIYWQIVTGRIRPTRIIGCHRYFDAEAVESIRKFFADRRAKKQEAK